jgi:non-ribosomal peptide synthetase component E (peptide arylation enzyme)
MYQFKKPNKQPFVKNWVNLIESYKKYNIWRDCPFKDVNKYQSQEEEDQLPLEENEKNSFEYDESDDDLRREDISFTGDSAALAHPAGRSLSLDPAFLPGQDTF